MEEFKSQTQADQERAIAAAAAGVGTVLYADNVALLKANIGSATRPIAVLGGYNAIGDGGGGVFYWSPSSALVDNGGTILAHSAGGGAWVRIYSGAVDVRWFGAGLGAADDAPLIQHAIEAALHDGVPWSGGKPTFTTGGTVRLPAGNYNLQQPIFIETSDVNFPHLGGWVSLRLVGDGRFNTHIRLIGPYTTAFIAGGLTGPDASRIRHCEISNLSIEQVATEPQRLGGAISFPYGGGLGFLISDIAMFGVYQGITCTASGNFNNVTINNVAMEGVINCGIYTQYALNWIVSNTIINMLTTPQLGWVQGTFAVHLEGYSEGWMWNNVFLGAGDACLRSSNLIGAARPPTEHQFHSCNFDEGGRACIWISNMHRCTFNGCWASSQAAGQTEFNGAILTGAFVIDNRDVRAVNWLNGTMVNISTYGFWVTDAESFSIINSTFSDWGQQGAASTFQAITIYPHNHTNFVITGNTFLKDTDFGENPNPWVGITVQSGSPAAAFNKYVVANNISYGQGGIGNLPGSVGRTLDDNGTATGSRKYVPAGSNI
jgi:hypothetical protein